MTALLAYTFVASCSAQANFPPDQMSTATYGETQNPPELRGAFIHGTIDLIISTREGFVLATDSRITNSDGTHSDNGEKLFAIGKHSAVTIAGIVGASAGSQGFTLRDAIASSLLTMDKLSQGKYISASTVAAVAASGAEGVFWLLTGPGPMPDPVVSEKSNVLS
jgi:20S proteasome alpha/beta subunit